MTRWVGLLVAVVLAGCDAGQLEPAAGDGGPGSGLDAGGGVDASSGGAAGGSGGSGGAAGEAGDAGAAGEGGADSAVDPAPEPGAGCETLAPGRRSLRRLSHRELSNTLRDLLGVSLADFGDLAPDRVVHGFENNGAVLQVGPLLADQYRLLAEAVAESVSLPEVLPCGTRDRACATAFIRDLGGRLFRRPLTGSEIGRYLALYDLAAPDGFEPGVRWVLVALLQSPHFLYRTELGRADGAGFVLTPFEIATELSYLFWQTTPDAELLARAADGQLLDAEVRAAQVARLAADPRSAETMVDFTVRWLDLSQLASVPRDPELYAALTPEVRAAMAEQTRRFVTELWEGGGTLRDLLSADYDYVDASLAAYYGVPAPAEAGFGRVDVTGTPYGGILSHGSVLTAHAKPISSSPIHRGKLVRERLLCQDLPPPPAGLDTSPPDVDDTLSTRDRYAQHSADPVCSGCHRLMDPLGFAFEHFDGIGRFRETDAGHPVDARGVMLEAGPVVHFEGLGAMQAVLADTPQVYDCYTRQWLRFGLGVDETDAALDFDCHAIRLTRDDAGLAAVMRALVDTPHFRRRTGEDGELDVPGAELTPTAPGEPVAPPPEPVDPDPPVEPPLGEGVTPGAVLTLVEGSRWDSGYCVQAEVRNETDAPLRWIVAAEIEGRIDNLWSAESTADSGRVLFSGLDWNAELQPGAAANFGFCAQL